MFHLGIEKAKTKDIVNLGRSWVKNVSPASQKVHLVKWRQTVILGLPKADDTVIVC